MFSSKNIIIKPSLQNFIARCDALQIVVVMKIPYDLHSLYKPLKNGLIRKALACDCVQILCKNVKYKLS